MKKGQESLGANLHRHQSRRRQDHFREALSQAAAAALKEIPQGLSEEQVAAVDLVFDQARKMLERFAGDTEWADDSITFGETGPSSGGWGRHHPAMKTLEQACWPMSIGEGLQLESNRFHAQWKKLCSWAAKEELSLEFESDTDKLIQRTTYTLRAIPRMGWVVR